MSCLYENGFLFSSSFFLILSVPPPHYFTESDCQTPVYNSPPPLPPTLTLLLDFQYQVISLQGGIGRDMDCLNGPSHRGVDHCLHLHGREDTQRLTLLHLS